MIVLVNIPVRFHHQVQISVDHNFIAIKYILEPIKVVLSSLLLISIDFIYPLILKSFSLFGSNAWISNTWEELNLFLSI